MKDLLELLVFCAVGMMICGSSEQPTKWMPAIIIAALLWIVIDFAACGKNEEE